MGRTLPSATQIVFKLIGELEPFYLALRRSDQLILDKFFEAILQHHVPLGNAASLLPMMVLIGERWPVTRANPLRIIPGTLPAGMTREIKFVFKLW